MERFCCCVGVGCVAYVEIAEHSDFRGMPNLSFDYLIIKQLNSTYLTHSLFSRVYL
jgi:hypothetical protein